MTNLYRFERRRSFRMEVRVLRHLQLAIVLLAAWLAPIASAAPATRPNVVVVLVDDVGYGDFSCLGSPILKTPNIDKLHAQSVRLTDFHVSPMCTPTRSQLLTGVDALANGAMNVSSGRSNLRRDVPTLAELFVAAGYRTATFGKWHLGDVAPYRPQDRGFQTALWFPSSHISSSPDHWNNDYFDPYLRQTDGSEVRVKGYCTDVFFDKAMAWMGDRARADEPFFAYLPLNAAHAPWYVPDKYREPYRKLPAKLASFYGMIANVDENMARLDAFLTEAKLADNTLLIFMTDNGGTVGVSTFNAGMKGSKISLFDGGHRVPCFLRLPSGDLGKPRDVDTLTQVQDVLPTLADLCHLDKPKTLSGRSLLPLLKSGEPLADRKLVVQFSRMNKPVPAKDDAAVLWKKWRLVNGSDLYDVAADPHQDRNVAADHPDVVKQMKAHYDSWWAAVSPQLNEPSPVPIGGNGGTVTLLSTADWWDVCLDQQRQVRTAPAQNGLIHLTVAKDGTYQFELRRYPREADAALTAAVPEFTGVDGKFPAGVALPIARANFRLGDVQLAADVRPEDKSVTFDLPLKAGPVQLQTSFSDKAGKELCGAYYVYAWRRE